MGEQRTNIFDQKFNDLSESHDSLEHIRISLTEGLKELNDLKRLTSNKQAALNDVNNELQELRSSNQKIKHSLIKAMIEKDETIIKKKSLISQIEQFKQQLDHFDLESDNMLNDETIDQLFDRLSTKNQMSTIKKIQEARFQLMKYQK